eukprot:Tamp_13585.p5 GENE.Tamp_13585~~Tamp_13585.p5  ORF type:complete len:140 (+),score=26.00 Tamp_13585:277-696(+)
MSAIGGPTAMMIDIAQVQPGFELQTLVPATTLVMLTLGGFGLRNEIKEIAKDLSADIKDISNQVTTLDARVHTQGQAITTLSADVNKLSADVNKQGQAIKALDAQVQKQGQDMRHDRQETNRLIVGLVRDIGRLEGWGG